MAKSAPEKKSEKVSLVVSGTRLWYRLTQAIIIRAQSACAHRHMIISQTFSVHGLSHKNPSYLRKRPGPEFVNPVANNDCNRASNKFDM